MRPLRKILAAHDFSAPADGALDAAADLARRYAASITILNVSERKLVATSEAYLLYQSDELQGLIDELYEKLAGVGEVLSAAGAVQVATAVRTGTPAEEIVREATEGNYDLIVLGTHGRRGMSHALLGSVAEQVVRRAPCPVLSVRMSEAPLTRAPRE